MIYVLGSLNADLVFNVNKVPKGGETLASESFNVFCGGKGANQAVAIRRLGSEVKMIGAVGRDSFGTMLKSNLINEKVDAENVFIKGDDSGLAAILVEKKGENRIILNGGANMRLDNADVDEGLKNAKSGDILLMQLEVPIDTVCYAAKAAKDKGMTVILNPAPAKTLPYSIYPLIDIITPNETETEILTDVKLKGIVEITLAVKKFYSLGVKNVIITLGSRGAVVSHGQNITEIQARKVKVVDTTAAGDTFVGAVADRIAKGWDIVKSCFYANTASSITITKLGASVSIPSSGEVDKIFSSEYSE